MADRLITKMEKNTQEEIRFSLQEYRGTDLIDIRVYFESAGGQMKPTKKGISVPVDRFDEFMECLKNVKKTISTSND